MDTVDKLRAKIQVGTVLAVLLLTIAVGLLAVTGVYRGVLEERKIALQNEIEKIRQDRQSILDEIEYRTSEAYIEEFARQYGMLLDGENKYVPAE